MRTKPVTADNSDKVGATLPQRRQQLADLLGYLLALNWPESLKEKPPRESDRRQKRPPNAPPTGGC